MVWFGHINNAVPNKNVYAVTYRCQSKVLRTNSFPAVNSWTEHH